jgi:hypothetical protein
MAATDDGGAHTARVGLLALADSLVGPAAAWADCDTAAALLPQAAMLPPRPRATGRPTGATAASRAALAIVGLRGAAGLEALPAARFLFWPPRGGFSQLVASGPWLLHIPATAARKSIAEGSRPEGRDFDLAT